MMDEDKKRKLTNRYSNYASRRPRHRGVPDRDQSYDVIKGTRRITNREKTMIRARPKTVREVRLGWEGLVALLDFFGGDRKLAASSCGVSVPTINRIIKLGYVTPYVALCAAEVEGMPWSAAGLCRYLEYDYQWDLAQREQGKDKKMRALLKDRAKKKLSWMKQPPK
jgi:hypothetical protein